MLFAHLYKIRGHSKSKFAQNFHFLTPPLSCSSLFVLHVPPSQRIFTLMSYTLPPLKKKLMNFRMKIREVKREKRIFKNISIFIKKR